MTEDSTCIVTYSGSVLRTVVWHSMAEDAVVAYSGSVLCPFAWHRMT